MWSRGKLFGFFADVFVFAEAEDEVTDWSEEEEADFEAGAFAEGVAELDGFVNGEEDGVDKASNAKSRNESSKDAETERNGEDVNPEVDADDAAEDVDVVDGDEGLPAGLTSFDEDLPPGDDEQDVDGEGKDAISGEHAAKDAASDEGFVLS